MGKQLLPVLAHFLTDGRRGTAPEDAAAAAHDAREEKIFATATDETIENWRRSMSEEEFSRTMDRYEAYKARAASKAPDADGDPAEDREIAATAERLYRALCESADRLVGLAAAFLARAQLTSLPQADHDLLAELAAAAFPGGSNAGARHLWTALLSRAPQDLAPLVLTVQSRTPWGDVNPKQKVLLMKVVRRALIEATGGRAA